MLVFNVYYPIQFPIFKELKRNIAMSNNKYQKHGVFYEGSYLPNYAINYFFQNLSRCLTGFWVSSMNYPTYHCAGHSSAFHIKVIGVWKPIFVKSSVNDVKCSNAVVSEFMNEVII